MKGEIRQKFGKNAVNKTNKPKLKQLAWDTREEIMFREAEKLFAEKPYSNGRDNRYEAVKALLRSEYGKDCIHEQQKKVLKDIAVKWKKEMWEYACAEFSKEPFSNGHDDKYESVKNELRRRYGRENITALKRQLKDLAKKRGKLILQSSTKDLLRTYSSQNQSAIATDGPQNNEDDGIISAEDEDEITAPRITRTSPPKMKKKSPPPTKRMPPPMTKKGPPTMKKRSDKDLASAGKQLMQKALETKTETKQSFRDQPRFKKFNKLLKMRVREVDVRRRMKREGISASDIDTFFNSEEAMDEGTKKVVALQQQARKKAAKGGLLGAIQAGKNLKKTKKGKKKGKKKKKSGPPPMRKKKPPPMRAR